MDLISPWAVPHAFRLLPVDDEAEPVDVVTLAPLLVPRLVGLLAAADGLAQLGREVGFEWLASLELRLRDLQQREDDGESELERHLRESCGIVGVDYRQTRFSLEGIEPGATAGVPSAVLADFAETRSPRIRDWFRTRLEVVDEEAIARRAGAAELVSAVQLRGARRPAFAGLDASIGDLASARQRVPAGYAEAARGLLDEVPVRLQLVRIGEAFAFRSDDLLERVVLEFQALAVARPTLRLCRLCRRPFVPPRRGESYCGSNLWRRSDQRLIARCVPAQQLAELEHAERERESDYRRQQKTAHRRMRREVKRFGEDHLRADRAREKYEAWKRENPNPAPRSPGRPREASEPIPPTLPE